MPELIYIGPDDVAIIDPPLGQLEVGASIHVEDEQAKRLLATGYFEAPKPPPEPAPPQRRRSAPEKED